MKYEKTCVICGAEFKTSYPKTIVCSDECKKARRKEMDRKYREENPEVIQACTERRLAKLKEIRKQNKKARKSTANYMLTEKPLKLKSVILPTWLERYKASDEMGKMELVARDHGEGYGWAQTIKFTNPERWKKLEREAVRRHQHDNEV